MDFETILERSPIVKEITDFLVDFEKNKTNELAKRGVYIYGPTGVGKTHLINSIIQKLNYDMIQYDAGDVRNKSMVEMLNTQNISDSNILGIFKQVKKKLIIVIDDIDCMNTGDKGGINSLIKLIRPKKTKNQKADYTTHIPVICVGNMCLDKKIKELMKCCLTVEISKPTLKQLTEISRLLLPGATKQTVDFLSHFADGDLKQLTIMSEMVRDFTLTPDMLTLFFNKRKVFDDAKKTTKKILNTNLSMSDHLTVLNEMDRTMVALLIHENIIDLLEKIPKNEAIVLYSTILENICLADCIDRVTFQKQIWQFNEMNSLVKSFYTSHLFHQKSHLKIQDIRFTKVLTKYSTEYNNDVFIQKLCMQLGMDKKDLYAYMTFLRKSHTDAEIAEMFRQYDVTLLDVNRLFRFFEI